MLFIVGCGGPDPSKAPGFNEATKSSPGELKMGPMPGKPGGTGGPGMGTGTGGPGVGTGK